MLGSSSVGVKSGPGGLLSVRGLGAASPLASSPHPEDVRPLSPVGAWGVGDFVSWERRAGAGGEGNKVMVQQ